MKDRRLPFSALLNLIASPLLAAILLFPSTTARSADSSDVARITRSDSAADSARFIVRIERREIVNRNILDTLDITLESFTTELAGFDFKVASNDPSLDISEIIRGKIYDSCQWDYFSARRINTTGKTGYPIVLWHVVGLARAMPGASKPLCFGFDRETPLIRLVVSNEHVLQMPETEAAVFFFWEKCTDNVVSGLSGSKLAISSRVLDYLPVTLPPGDELFPSRRGTPTQCVNLSRPNYPLRQIEFHNGGISFRYDLSRPPADSASDSTSR